MEELAPLAYTPDAMPVSMPKPGSYSRQAIKLRLRVTCPHCWHVFAPQQALWISQHPDLIGDARLGADHQQRFLPTRFTVEGAASTPGVSPATTWRARIATCRCRGRCWK